eukprot:15194518-Alexandrium_andersonii.AAC.1
MQQAFKQRTAADAAIVGNDVFRSSKRCGSVAPLQCFGLCSADCVTLDCGYSAAVVRSSAI